MTKLTESYLRAALGKCRHFAVLGKVADYIPELGKVDPRMLGISIQTCQGRLISAGDAEIPFTMQSVSKVISLLVALEDHGEQAVFHKVGMEPTGDVFNSIRRLETHEDHKPLNPMINAGAIAVASLIKGASVEERFRRIVAFMRAIAGNPHLRMNEAVYRSERKTGDRNRALAYFMKSTGIIETNVEEALDLYFRFNAIEVTCKDLARMGCFLSRNCVPSGTEQPSVPLSHIRTAMAIMMTSGMYNASGEFAARVGIPAKSGVSGGILAVVPGKMGIGILGPAIDDKGNSMAGVQLLQLLSEELGLSLFA